MSRIQQADPGARRKVIRTLILSGLIGTCAIAAFGLYERALQSWLVRNIDSLAQQASAVFIGALVFASPLLFSAVYYFSLGRRVMRSQRFPPPGYAVYRDTPVLEGRSAIRRGLVMQILSVILLSAAALLPMMFVYLVRGVVDPS